MTLRRNELRNAARYVQLYTIRLEYWRSRLAYLERSYWEAANAWRDQRGIGHMVIPKANASPAKASPGNPAPPKLQASMPASP
eukprot:6831911-Alexandrium_andersonii.AAC.1